MAESKTQTAPKLHAAVGKVFQPFHDAIVTLAGELTGAERTVALVTLNLGATISESVSEMLKVKGATAEEAQTRIVSALADAGRSVEWKTVERWTKAAKFAAGAPDDVRSAFGVDSWVALGAIKEDDERFHVAEGLRDQGITAPKDTPNGKMGVRRAVREYLGKDEKEPKMPLELAGTLQRKVSERDEYVSVREAAIALDLVNLADGSPNDEGRQFVRDTIMLGIIIGQNGNVPKSKHYGMVADQLFSWDDDEDEPVRVEVGQ